jgi:uncharacterized membrane protein
MLDPVILMTIPKDLKIFLMAMLPIIELRGALPYAICVRPEVMIPKAYLLAVLGNFVPVIPILLFLEPVSNILRKVPLFDRFFVWLFARTRRRAEIVEKYEAIGLTLFVAIPLPVTGAWTGALAAFIFGIRRRWAIPCIALGVMIAGVIVILACKAGLTIFADLAGRSAVR